MGRIKTIVLSATERRALEDGFKKGDRHTFRIRCKMILLKSESNTSEDIAKLLNTNIVSVNSWVFRYETQGIEGLKTKAGRGRKCLMDKNLDKESVLASIRKHRQRLQTAKAEWEEQSGKSVGQSTFRTFLKSLVEDINE